MKVMEKYLEKALENTNILSEAKDIEKWIKVLEKTINNIFKQYKSGLIDYKSLHFKLVTVLQEFIDMGKDI